MDSCLGDPKEFLLNDADFGVVLGVGGSPLG